MLVLAICCMSLLIVSLDNTILNVALPSMQKDFHASVSGLQWTIDAYLVVLASLLLLSGSTGDRIGRRRIFLTGLVIFTAGSVLCSLAPGLDWLIGFRMVQAVGGSMLNPVAMSIITNTFADPKERARAIGVWSGVIGISMAAGPIVGGALVESVGWRSIFWINLPVGVAALLLTARFVPESRAPRPRRIDPVGQLLVIVLLGALTYGIIEGSDAGWGSPLIVGCFTVAVAAVAALASYERRRADPLIDTRFFRSVPFAGATVIAVCGFAALGGFLFLNTLYLQDDRGLSALEAGLYMVPMALMCLIFAPLSGRLVGARGARLPLVLAGATMAASGVLLAGARRAVHRLAAVHLLRAVRHRLRPAQRADHQHRRVRHAARAGRSGGGGRLHQPAGGPVAGRRRPRRGPGGGTAHRRMVDHCRVRGGCARARSAHHRPVGPRHGGTYGRGAAGARRGGGPGGGEHGMSTAPGAGTVSPADAAAVTAPHTAAGAACVPGAAAGAEGAAGPGPAAAERVWQGLRALVLERNERRKETADALGMSFFRVKALRRIAAKPYRMSELAAELASDRPYLTLVVDDLEKRGLVERRQHPTDRRSKIVSATEAGRRVAAEANAILGNPPPALRGLPAEDLAALDRIVARLVAAQD